MVGIQHARSRHSVVAPKFDLGRQAANIRCRENDEDVVEVIDRLVPREHKGRPSRPIRMLGPANLAASHHGSWPAARSS